MRNQEPANLGILTTTSWLRQQQPSSLLVFVVFVPLGCGFRCFCFSFRCFRCFRCRSQLVGSAGWLVRLASSLAGQPASWPAYWFSLFSFLLDVVFVVFASVFVVFVVFVVGASWSGGMAGWPAGWLVSQPASHPAGLIVVVKIPKLAGSRFLIESLLNPYANHQL